MRVTARQLRSIIQEEVSRVLREVDENMGEMTIKIYNIRAYCGKYPPQTYVDAIKGVSATVGGGRIGFEDMGGGYDPAEDVVVGFGTAADINEFKNTVMQFFKIPASDIEIGPGVVG